MTKLTPTEARQARRGFPVLVVLAISVAIAVVAVGGVALFTA
ncbi:hypothetical protein SAMN05660686_03484 [Thalassobaculum litoreum DSM 18839]|uniref:Uncharacterized protein n=1 Tax=Thalassobaculum litoreum DSM 18839 TaxID=1123362 RepID=A0A8G2BK04_9PROT|nr:hypothetical protein SAMN05660686_03484 [Thalassobaculum litoreum DSM 18839]